MYYSSHLIRFIIFALSLLCVIPLGDTYDYTPTYDVETDFYIVMVVIISTSAINLLGTLYIFYRTFLRWRYDSINIALSLRLPFYIAITDFLYSLATLINNSHSAANLTNLLKDETITWASPFCEFIGFFNTTFAFLNIFLVGAISVITWLRVVQEFYFDLGKYDYKIWTPVSFMSLIVPLISVRDFGDERYACGARYQGSIIIVASVIIILTLSIIIFCYLHVLKTIRKNNSSLTQFASVQSNNIEKRSLKKVLTYILIFILQYIPILAFNVAGFLQVQHVLVYTATAAICIGGIGNLIQYLFNEGLVFRPSSFISSNNNFEENKQRSQRSQRSNNSFVNVIE